MEAKQTNLFDKETPSQYFNTTSQSGDDLKKKASNAKTQADKILTVFKNAQVWLTPWDVHNAFHGKIPITSIRARITVLEQSKLLIKSEYTTKDGPYKTSCYQWKFNPQK